MKVVYSLADAAVHGPSVLSIGNFDGVHLGHQAILRAVTERARRYGVRAAAMTFDPHPLRVLAPEKAPPLISTLEQKIRWMQELGIELVFVARFDDEFARLSPQDFVQRYLIAGLRVRALCVGSNFSFGFRQAGTLATLRQWSDAFELVEVQPVRLRGAGVSSSRIRSLVGGGAVGAAGRLLGRWLELDGRIVGGDGRGSVLTAPTLNLAPENELLPAPGVYVTQISLSEGAFMDSVTNVGFRPTFGGDALTVETYVPGKNDLPAATDARLRFLHRIRDERRFESPVALKAQIQRDAARALQFFRLLRIMSRHAESHSH